MNSFLNLRVMNLVLRILPANIRNVYFECRNEWKRELLSGLPVR